MYRWKSWRTKQKQWTSYLSCSCKQRSIYIQIKTFNIHWKVWNI